MSPLDWNSNQGRGNPRRIHFHNIAVQWQHKRGAWWDEKGRREARPPAHLTCSNLPKLIVCRGALRRSLVCLFPLLLSCLFCPTENGPDQSGQNIFPISAGGGPERERGRANRRLCWPFQPPSTGNRASKLLPINSKRLRIHVLKLKYSTLKKP